MTEPLSAAASDLLGLTLNAPSRVEVVRGDTPQDVGAELDWAPGASRTAAQADLTLRSELAGGPVTATDRPFAPEERLTATIPVTAGADSTGGVMEATARVRVGPGTIVLEEQTELVVVEPVALDITPAQVVVGGSIQRPFEVTVTNRLSRSLDMEVGVAGPDGLSISPSASTLTVPARGSETIRPTLAREGVSDGEHTLVVTASPITGDVPRLQKEVDLFTSDEIAVNPFGTGFPQASATSSQDAQPPALANDGDAATFWVSAGTQPGQGPSPQAPQVLTIDLGAPAPLGAVTVVPRTGYGPKDMVIEGRIGGTWQALATVSQADGTQQHAVPQSTVDAVRLRITSGHDRVQPNRNVQVAEIQLSEEGPPPSPVATASSSQANFPPDLAVDGNPSTFWVSQTGATEAAPQWLAVDLGRPLSISRLAVTPRLNGANDHGPRAMVWQIGDGHGGWTDVVRREKPFRASDSVDVEVEAQHVRLLITSVWDSRNQNVQVAELKVTAR